MKKKQDIYCLSFFIVEISESMIESNDAILDLEGNTEFFAELDSIFFSSGLLVSSSTAF